MMATICACLLSQTSAAASDKKEEIVTFADFRYVTSVASSISHVYFATTRGIIRFNKVEERWEDPLTGNSEISDQKIQQIWVETFDEKLYVRTDIGLYEYDIFFHRWFPIGNLPELNRSYTTATPPEDLLPTPGENYFGEGNFIDRLGREYSISQMILDQSGTYWIGTWGNGPARAPTTSRVVEQLTFGLTQDRINSIYADDSLIWLAGDRNLRLRGGITGFNPISYGSVQIESGGSSDFPEVDINIIHGDDQYLYIGSEQGLFLLERSSLLITHEIYRRHGLTEDRITSLMSNGDTLFVGTDGGLSMITHSFDSVAAIYPRQFYDQTIYDLEIIGNHLWIASSIGAFRLSLKNHKLQSYRDSTELLFSRVYDIESEADNIWFGSDGGLLRLDSKSGKSEVFQSQSIQIDRRVIAVNKYVAAINSLRGVTLFFRTDPERISSREFTVDDGLASPYITSLYLDGDYLWIGSDRGLTRFLWNDPDRVD